MPLTCRLGPYPMPPPHNLVCGRPRSLSARVVLLSLFLSLLFPLPSAASWFDLQAEGPHPRRSILCVESESLVWIRPEH